MNESISKAILLAMDMAVHVLLIIMINFGKKKTDYNRYVNFVKSVCRLQMDIPFGIHVPLGILRQ